MRTRHLTGRNPGSHTLENGSVTDKQTDRQKDQQTDRQTDRKTDR
jgi:hypothetical protein